MGRTLLHAACVGLVYLSVWLATECLTQVVHIQIQWLPALTGAALCGVAWAAWETLQRIRSRKRS